MIVYTVVVSSGNADYIAFGRGFPIGPQPPNTPEGERVFIAKSWNSRNEAVGILVVSNPGIVIDEVIDIQVPE